MPGLFLYPTSTKMAARAAFASFLNGYRSLRKKGGDSAKEKVLLSATGTGFLDYPELWTLTRGCSGRHVLEIVPGKDHRRVFFHLELKGDTPPRASRVRDPKYVRSVVRKLHEGLRRQLQDGMAFSFFFIELFLATGA